MCVSVKMANTVFSIATATHISVTHKYINLRSRMIWSHSMLEFAVCVCCMCICVCIVPVLRHTEHSIDTRFDVHFTKRTAYGIYIFQLPMPIHVYL